MPTLDVAVSPHDVIDGEVVSESGQLMLVRPRPSRRRLWLFLLVALPVLGLIVAGFMADGDRKLMLTTISVIAAPLTVWLAVLVVRR